MKTTEPAKPASPVITTQGGYALNPLELLNINQTSNIRENPFQFTTLSKNNPIQRTLKIAGAPVTAADVQALNENEGIQNTLQGWIQDNIEQGRNFNSWHDAVAAANQAALGGGAAPAAAPVAAAPALAPVNAAAEAVPVAAPQPPTANDVIDAIIREALTSEIDFTGKKPSPHRGCFNTGFRGRGQRNATITKATLDIISSTWKAKVAAGIPLKHAGQLEDKPSSKPNMWNFFIELYIDNKWVPAFNFHMDYIP